MKKTIITSTASIAFTLVAGSVVYLSDSSRNHIEVQLIDSQTSNLIVDMTKEKKNAELFLRKIRKKLRCYYA